MVFKDLNIIIIKKQILNTQSMYNAHHKENLLTLPNKIGHFNFDIARHEYCKAALWTRAPIKAVQPICYNDVWRANIWCMLHHCLCFSLLSRAFCNGNQRFVLKTPWQLSVNCLKSVISRDLYRAAVMSPKLEMSVVEQRLFSISFLFLPSLSGHTS